MGPDGDGGGFGGRRGRGGPPGERPDTAAMRSAMSALATAPRVTLQVTDTSLMLEREHVPALTLPLNGHGVREFPDDGDSPEWKADWHAGALRVRLKLPDGSQVSERYELGLTGERLLVLRQVTLGRGRSVEYRVVYDRTAAP